MQFSFQLEATFQIIYVCPPDTQKIKFVAIVVAVSCCLSLLLLLLLTLSADISMLQDGRAPNAAPARKHCPLLRLHSSFRRRHLIR